MNEVARKIRDGDARALAKAATGVENRDPQALAILEELAPFGGHARIVGITGPPGAGKSTLVDALAREIRRQGKTVAIVAVDPSSRATGGAILGDRIRMQQHHADSGIFIRSMATRGTTGGLAVATADLSRLMDAAGRDFVLIETVGVGQAEIEIADLAQVTVVVLVPGMGDDVQTIKAGIMEIADIFVINKADQPGADRVGQELQGMLSLSHGKMPPIVRTIATNGKGVDTLLAAIVDLPVKESTPAAPASPSASSNLSQPPQSASSPDVKQPSRSSATPSLSQPSQSASSPDVKQPSQSSATPSLSQSASPDKEQPPPSAALLKGGWTPWSAADPLVGHRTQSDALHIDHLGIAVRALEDAVAFYQTLGLQVAHRENIAIEKVNVAMLPLHDSNIELLEPTSPDSPISHFLEKRGPGLHHIALRVPDLSATIDRLRGQGARLLNEPRPGAGGHLYVFVHPASTGGVLLELIQEERH